MSTTPFVATLRARAETIQLTTDASALTIRAQLFEAWDTVRIVALPTDSISAVKMRALEALDPTADVADLYVVTLRGAMIIDETQSLAQAGVVNGSTLLIAFRHRRPVR